MRHRKKNIKLGRKTAHRKAMLANLACSLIEHKRINTTITKAKALKRFIEPLVTKTKDDSTHNRRIVFRYLRNKKSVSDLFRTISNKIGDRPGGYTRIIKLGKRKGDNADMAMIEFVDFNELYLKSNTTKKTTRRGRSKTKSQENNKDTNIKTPKSKIEGKANGKVSEKDQSEESLKSEDKTTKKEESKATVKKEDKTTKKEESKVTVKKEDKISKKEDGKTSNKKDNKSFDKSN